MRTYLLNNQTPSLKQGEFNSSSVGIIVPEDMRAYTLFLVFALPSGTKVFTPSLLIDTNFMVVYPLPATVLSEIGRVQVELQGFKTGSYIKSITFNFSVVQSLTGPTNGSGSELKQVDYLPWYTEAAGFKTQVETLTNAYKVDEALRISKEIARVAAESARVIAENNRTTGENTRIANENQRIANLALFDQWVDPLTGIEARVDAIITTPVGSVSAQKIIDARGGETTLGAKLIKLDVQTAQNTSKLVGRRSILYYQSLVLNVGLANEDWKDALQAARNDLANATQKYKLVFPAGIYKYSISPNWAINNAIIESDGEVRFRYTGTGNAVILDAGEVTGLTWHMKFGEFLIEAPSTAMNALFVRGVHGSEIKAKILGAGTNYAGCRVEWCVCSDFHITCSVNHEGWYLGAKPKYGIYVDKRELQPVGQGGYTSWCSFYSPKIEGTEVGIHLERSQGCSFYSGTSEACTQTGVVLSNNAIYNKFFGLDMEANTNYDINCLGRENEFYSVDSTGTHLFDGFARDNVMTGGSHNIITLGASTYGNLLQNIKYNRFNNGAVLNDISGKNRLMSNRNVGLNRTENRPPSSSPIVVGASPFTYANVSGNDELINIFGGTVSSFLYVHGGYGDSSATAPQLIRLCPGDTARVTYSVLPTMRKYTT